MEDEKETMKLPILPIKPNSHSHSLSSPIHSSISASIPFSWEEEPGKPKPKLSSLSSSTSSSTSSSPDTLKSLELPPRLLQLQSPITVFDGPFSITRSRRLDSPSFRMMVKGNNECYGSFRSDIYVEEEEEENKNSLVVVKKRGRLGFFGFRRRKALKKGKTEFGRGSYVFPSENREEEEGEEKSFGYGDGISTSQSSRFCEVKINNITRTGSFSTHPASTTPTSSKSHFWTNVYAGLKQVVPWKNKKITS